MDYIGFDKRFTLLTQEAHLTKNTLLSGFDLLLKANFFQDKDGFFYSAFFHLSIGIERMLKLAVVTDHMLKNNYATPTKDQLKNKYGHKINILYDKCLELCAEYCRHSKASIKAEFDQDMLSFFTKYSVATRYFNLNELCEVQSDRSPLYQWLDIIHSVYEDSTTYKARESAALKLMYRMDREGPMNGFTKYLSERGDPMMVFDILHRQHVVKKSTPLIIWKIIELLKPIHSLLTEMSYAARKFESETQIADFTIPHYEDFFYFLNSSKDSIKRRKRWLDTFNN
jgi:hypothetical protein